MGNPWDEIREEAEEEYENANESLTNTFREVNNNLTDAGRTGNQVITGTGKFYGRLGMGDIKGAARGAMEDGSEPVGDLVDDMVGEEAPPEPTLETGGTETQTPNRVRSTLSIQKRGRASTMLSGSSRTLGGGGIARRTLTGS